jgi:hypothetical protein
MNLRINPWYLNFQRSANLLGCSDYSTFAASDHWDKMKYGQLISRELSNVLEKSNIRGIQELLIKGEFKEGILTFYDGMFYSNGFNASNKTGDLSLKVNLEEYGLNKHLILKFHKDNLYTSTGYSILQGRPTVFALFVVREITDNEVIASPIIIGDWVEGAYDLSSRYRDKILLHPSHFDVLNKVDFSQQITHDHLNLLKEIRESEIKNYFAEIFKQNVISKDWGGEECDLYQGSVYVEKESFSCAFMFKGPSKFHPMRPADCGANGDQIVRLFDTDAEIMVLQHCHEILPSVRKTILAFAASRKKKYCTINGFETLIILKHFGYIK